MMEQIQILRMELASVLCDVSRYLSEDEREEIRSTDPKDFINSLLKNEAQLCLRSWKRMCRSPFRFRMDEKLSVIVCGEYRFPIGSTKT